MCALMKIMQTRSPRSAAPDQATEGPPARLGKSFNWTGVLTESLRKKVHVRFREKGVRSLASSRAEPLA